MTDARPLRDEAAELIGELAVAYHQTGGIRDHVDRTQTEWIVGAIETCGDPLCREALELVARLSAP